MLVQEHHLVVHLQQVIMEIQFIVQQDKIIKQHIILQVMLQIIMYCLQENIGE